MLRTRSTAVALEVWAAGVWLCIGTLALLVPVLWPAGPVNGYAALAEVVLCAPVAVWLASLSAGALRSGRWWTFGRSVGLGSDPFSYWLTMTVAIFIAGVFLAGFVRGLISLVLVL